MSEFKQLSIFDILGEEKEEKKSSLEKAKKLAKKRVGFLYRKSFPDVVTFACNNHPRYDKRDRYLIERMSKVQIIAMMRTVYEKMYSSL